LFIVQFRTAYVKAMYCATVGMNYKWHSHHWIGFRDELVSFH